MSYPVPSNPYVGREKGEVVEEIWEACKKSWDVDPAWRIGDYFVVWCRMDGQDKHIDDPEAAAEFIAQYAANEDGEDITVTPDQLITDAEVCLAFPGPMRDLTRSFFDHYAGWTLATVPDQVSRRLKAMDESGEYDSR